MANVASELHIWLALGVIAIAIVLYISELFTIELTSLLVLGMLLLVFYLIPLPDGTGGNLLDEQALLAGFGNPALITIMAFLVMAQGLFQSAALETIISRFSKYGGRTPWVTLAALLIFTAIASALLNNTPIVLMAIPIVSALTMRANMSDHRFLMPLSFICILGGMTTLIGSSTNLLVANAMPPSITIGFFTQTIPGLVLASVGAIYVLWILPYLLRGRRADTQAPDARQADGRQYLMEIILGKDDPLIGVSSSAGFFPQCNPFTLRALQRGTQNFLPPFDKLTLQVGDTLLLIATRHQLEDCLRSNTHPLRRLGHFAVQLENDNDDDMLIAEAVVAPGSRMAQRNIHQTGFAYETGCTILGVQRQHGPVHRLADYRLRPGDVLLVLSSEQALAQLRNNRDVLPMEWRTSNVPKFATARRARWIFLLSVTSAASGLVPLLFTSLAGALGMILTRVLNIRQAARGLNLRIFLLVAAALAMATALERTGAAMWLAQIFIDATRDSSTAVILSIFFLLCALLTNLLSNNATAVLFAPIALNLAHQLDAPVIPFLMAVIFAANCSFATPIAYQTNMLVMAPGNYRFMDFLRFGGPLVFLLWLTYSIFAPWYYDL